MGRGAAVVAVVGESRISLNPRTWTRKHLNPWNRKPL